MAKITKLDVCNQCGKQESRKARIPYTCHVKVYYYLKKTFGNNHKQKCSKRKHNSEGHRCASCVNASFERWKRKHEK